MTFQGILIVLLVLAGAGYVLYSTYKQFRARQQAVETESKEHVLFSISVPKENEKTPEAAESLFAALHGIYKTAEELSPGESQEHISFEIVAHGEEIRFFCYAPKYLQDFVEGQIYAQYPEVEIREVNDYAQAHINEVFLETGETNPQAGKSTVNSELALTKEEFYPLKTFENFDVDPLASITGVLGKIKDEEDVWIQILVRPQDDSWQNKGIAYADAIKNGKDPNQTLFGILKKAVKAGLKDLIRITTNPEAEAGGGDEEVELSGPVSAAVEGIEEKVTKLGFETKIRLVASGPDKIQARNRLQSVVGAFKQYNTNNMNGFISSPIKYDDRLELEQYQKRLFVEKGYILNIEELASIFHLPNISVKTPNMVWAGSKKGEAPIKLPIVGDSGDEKDLTPYAKTDFRGKTEKFGIWQDDLRRHMYLIGKTGVGKTTCLQNMAIDKIRKGHGVGIIDPHGDFIQEILEFVPKERIKDVVMIDPSDRDFPVAFNPLENVDENQKNVMASGLVGIFKKIWADSWGPRLEHILRNTILALLDYPEATMLGVPKILVNQNYRDKVIEAIQDPVVKDFWVSEFGQYDDRFRTEAISPIQNKVGQFLAASMVRNILGQPKSTIDFKDVMDNKKILLMDLSKGKIGEDASALLGAMLITKIQLTAMQRAYIPEPERQDFTLFVDEFQNFATESFATILSEARKYNLSLIMANQYIAQMEEVVREAIFGNVGTLISFRVGPTDAPYLAKEFMPTFEEDDLINLDKFQIYNKMAIDGVTSPPFSAQTLPPYTNKENNQAEIREYTRTNFAKPREEVEKWLLEWDKKASKSQNELKEEKLEEITYKGKKMYPIVGTDGRAWFIEKDNNGSSNQNSKEKNNKNNSSDGKNRGNKSNPVANKQKTKKALREHLKNLSKQMESNKDDRKKGKALKKNNNSNNKDHNGNHVMEEGRKVSLNGS
jgi:hypothetical protein